jgi:sulfur-oxidizing protein SoxZ
MGEAIKIRAVLLSGEAQGIAEIRVLMQHPMETGLRNDPANGRTIAAHFIQTFTVSAHGKVLIEGQLNTSISRDPFFVFRARGLKVGDRIVVSWVDTQGDRRSDEATVLAD